MTDRITYIYIGGRVSKCETANDENSCWYFKELRAMEQYTALVLF